MRKRIAILAIGFLAVADIAGFGAYLSIRKPANDPYGTAGLLILPDSSTVKLYYCDPHDTDLAQSITDATASAAVLAIPGSPVIICDHGTQAFGILTDCEAGETITIEHCDGTRIGYECTAAYHDAVWSDGYTMLSNGTSVWNLNGKIVTQVCNDITGSSVTILVWE